ncbi:Gfo/Idh/MocA family protein [Mangrovihabitans endophyticus]|uniref:Oxidoreductase n=1 Tax=Mangrovihabitans endophyticus TaxID=1751298 RepID=A0A8J3BXT3_9ACTN|nr:Gfo/Idh/MocA family oxidoreductase [Mangrovihabitans endophyticus]GGK81651.1 oxidoreductase [Mangrovihabitans endophyticus]
MIRTAVVGYGLAGRVFHAPLITADPAYDLSAIVTGNPDRSAEAAERYPQTRVVARLDEVLDGEYDLIVVASPTPTHVDVAGEALRRGIATVVDKPLAVRAADAERLIAEAERTGAALTVFQNRRWDGDFRTVRKLIDSGALGEVWRFESRFEWLSQRPRPQWKSGTSGADGGGVAYDLGAHLIDQAVQLFGPVAGVYGELDAHRTGGVNDDDSFIALTHTGGVRSHLAMSSLVAQRGFRFRVLGTEGAYTKWGLDVQEAQLASGMSPLDPAFGVASSDSYGKLGREGELTSVATEPGGYREFYAMLAAALRDDGPLPVDPRDALTAIGIIENLHAQSVRA